MPRRRLPHVSSFAETVRELPGGRRVYDEGYSEGFGDGYAKGLRDAERGIFAPPGTRRRGNPHPKKRRKTAYQTAYSAAYKRLKKKHPRMAFGSLSKKAHAAARKKVKR